MSLRTLYQTLLDSDLARLHVIARQWEIALSAERRADVAAELADAMARAERVERMLSLLEDEQRAALDDLLRHEGAMPWAIFTRRWGAVRAVGPGRLEREELWRDPVSAAEALWYAGFVQRAFDTWPSGQVEMAFVPEELCLYLPPPPPLDLSPPSPVAAPRHQEAGDDRLADDLVTLWATLQVGVPAAREAAPQGPSRRRALVRTLALEQGWLHEDEQGVLRPAPEPVLAWLRADLWEQWASLARAWLESAAWNDLAHVPSLRTDSSLGWPNDPVRTRQALLAVLRRCEPGAWYEIPAFVAYVQARAPDFLRPDGDYGTWDLRDAATDMSLRGFDAWVAVEGALVTFVLTGPLAWLGLVDLGGAVPSLPPTAFRMNAAGAAVLDRGDPPEISAPGPVRVRGDGVVVVPRRRRYERFQLHRVAQLLGPSDDVRGAAGACGYRLTPASLARARRQHISAARIVSFLEEATGQIVPSYLREGIDRAYRADEAEAGLDRVWLLRVADPAVLEQPALQRWAQTALTPRMALIREEDRARVLAWLTQHGILPEVRDTSS
jgi:hypothetical protein